MQAIVNGAPAIIDVISAIPVGFDPNSHGTHVAGIAGGKKLIANDQFGTLARGVAPRSNLYIAKSCLSANGCVSSSAATIELAEQGADIINRSLGSNGPNNDEYNISALINDRIAEVYGALLLDAAGNAGPALNRWILPAKRF